MNILYVCNDLAYFRAHRRWLAELARRQGHKVRVACGNTDQTALAQGEIDFALDVERFRFNLAKDLGLMRAIPRHARETAADVVHLITIKPVLFGTVGLRLFRAGRQVVATFPGLGRVFNLEDRSWRARWRRWLVMAGLRFGLGSRLVTVVFETEADMRKLVQLGLVPQDRAVCVAGAGVETAHFRHEPLPPVQPLKLLFAGRLLRAKGVALLAEAALLVGNAGHHVEFWVAGPEQINDPDALTPDELAALLATRHVRFLGEVAASAMPQLLAQTHAVLLPTRYQEGIPRILIEAGAVGRPAIVSDNPGCLAFVRHEQSGLVLDELTPLCLAAAVIRLANDSPLLEQLSKGAYTRFIEGHFNEADVGRQTLALYRAQ